MWYALRIPTKEIEVQTTTSRSASATVRKAGKQYIHTVRDFDGDVVDTRRSNQRYRFAIAKRYKRDDGTPSIVVTRYSNASKAPGATFAIAIGDQA